MVEVSILDAFEKVWDQITKEVSAQRKQVKEWKDKGEEIKSQRLIDFSTLNLLTLRIARMNTMKTAEEISEIFENMPKNGKTIEQHREYFGYALINARYIEQDSHARIGKILREVKPE